MMQPSKYWNSCDAADLSGSGENRKYIQMHDERLVEYFDRQPYR